MHNYKEYSVTWPHISIPKARASVKVMSAIVVIGDKSPQSFSSMTGERVTLHFRVTKADKRKELSGTNPDGQKDSISGSDIITDRLFST